MNHVAVFALCPLYMQQQRLGKMANGVDAVLVADKKADTMENGSVVEDILTEEPESEMSSPFILPGEEVSLSHTFRLLALQHLL